MIPSLFNDEELSAMGGSDPLLEHPFQDHIRYFGVVLDPQQRSALYNELYQETPWVRRSMQMHGREVLMPRDIAWFGATKAQGIYAAGAAPWPPSLLRTKALVEELTGHFYNACLCNLYRTGEDSVAWHSDREAYRGAVASLSLGGTRTFRVRDRLQHAKSFNFPLPSGSLLVMEPGCQERYEHCVPKTRKAVEPRINLTFRQAGR